jgi:hypothetical protein
MDRLPSPENTRQKPSTVIRVSFESLPNLSSADIRNSTGVFLADTNLLVDEYLRANAAGRKDCRGDEERKNIDL